MMKFLFLRMIEFRFSKRLGFAVTLAGAFCLASSGGLRAQNGPSVVKAQFVLSTDAIRAGGSTRAAVVAEIASGFHINDHHPSLDYLIPTRLKVGPSRLLAVERITYPKGKPQKFAFSDTPLSVYEGTFEIGMVLEAARDAAPGEYPLRGKLEYQACNDRACLPPASVPVALTLKVVGRHAPLHEINSSVFRKMEPETER